ncbi:hypothetical protein D3C87_2030300 [compost metagenome]
MVKGKKLRIDGRFRQANADQMLPIAGDDLLPVQISIFAMFLGKNAGGLSDFADAVVQGKGDDLARRSPREERKF